MSEYDDQKRTTVRGKVVYRRKKHYFSQKDLERISKAIENRPETTQEDMIDVWLDFVFTQMRRLAPGWAAELMFLTRENWGRYFKRLVRGEYTNVREGWLGLVDTAFQNVKRLIDRYTINWIPLLRRWLRLAGFGKEEIESKVPEAEEPPEED